MKRWILACIVMPLFFSACADKKGNDNQVATVPPPTTCIDGSTYCNSNLYGQNNGYTAYPNNPYFYNPSYSWNRYYGAGGGGGYYGTFCHCPAGHRPVYNGQYGLGCVSVAQFQPVAYGAVYWSWGANNNQWVNMPQISNTQGYPTNTNNGCFQNVAQSCFVDQMNSCGPGATCQPTGGGSRLGICIAGNPSTTPGGTSGGFR